MHFACDSCQTRYQVPDEKIRGKTIRVQCKKCGCPIVVRDPALDAVSRPTPPPLPPQPTASIEKAEWFVAIAGTEVGPLTKTLVQERLASGEVHLRSYVWRDGMSSWLRLQDVPALVALLPSRPPPLPSETPPPETLAAREAPASSSNLSQPLELSREASASAAPADMNAFELGERTRAHFRDSAKQRSRKKGSGVVVGAVGVVAVGAIAAVVWWTHHAAASVAPPVTAEIGAATDAGSAAASPETIALEHSLGQAPAAPADAGPPAMAAFDQTALDGKIQALGPQMKKCIGDAYARVPDLKLEDIVITTSVEPTGKLGRIGFSHDSLRKTELGRCLQEAVKTLKMLPFDGEEQPVKIPLKLSAAP